MYSPAPGSAAVPAATRLGDVRVLAHFDRVAGQAAESIALEPGGGEVIGMIPARQVVRVAPDGAVRYSPPCRHLLAAARSDSGAVYLLYRCWHMFLRRFDIEHTFRLFKQTLGWTSPRLRDPEAADRWTWLMITAHTQLRLARPLAADLRRPWEKPAPPERLTPAGVRRGFRNIRAKTASPAHAPKPSHPGPGRPSGSRNTHRATRHNVGKTITATTTTSKNKNATG